VFRQPAPPLLTFFIFGVAPTLAKPLFPTA
jgi:hypothetical protein